MGNLYYLLLFLFLIISVNGKRGSSGSSWGRRGSSRGKSTSSTSTSSGGGWFSFGKTTSTGHASAPAPKPASAPATSYGWSNPGSSAAKPAGYPSWQSAPKPPAPKPASNGWQSATVPAPKPATNGWQNPSYNPSYKPVSTGYNPPKPVAFIPASHGLPSSSVAKPVANGWQNPSYNPSNKPVSTGHSLSPSSHGLPSSSVAKPSASNPSSAWQKPSAPPLPPAPPAKPVASLPLNKSPYPSSNTGPKIAGSATGWSNPSQAKPPGNTNLPSSNIGPGGYPVQGGMQRAGAPGLHPPPYSPANPHGTTSLNQGRVAPPSYSASNPHGNYGGGAPPAYSGGTSYNGPKKQIINNHYHYNSPPAYSPSQYGMSSGHYPTQNSFGYPGGGGFFGNNRPSYGGMGMFGGGGSGFGYPGSGSWGGYSSYGSGSSSGGMVKGLLIGAAGGYLASSLIRKVTNPWGYSGSGYGHGYMDRYDRQDRYDDRRYPTPAPQPVAVPDPTDNWINCVAFDPVTKVTLINPNCSCTVTTTMDPATGQNVSHHDCRPFGQPPSMIPSPPLPVWGVNNPPPSFNGSLYGSGGAYGGGGYGGANYGYPSGQPQGQPMEPQPGQPIQYQQPQPDQPMQYQQPQPGQPIQYQQTQSGQPIQYQQPQPEPPIQYQQPQPGQPIQYQQPAPVEGTPPVSEVQAIVQSSPVAEQPSVTTLPEVSSAVADATTVQADQPVSQPLTAPEMAKRKKFYSELQNIVNMGRFDQR